MGSLKEQPSIRWRSLGIVLLLSAATLGVHRQTYWRPFDDTAEESTVSCHAFGFAAASTVRLWPNPIVARHVAVEQGEVKPYPHWPNGFFLLLEGALRIFGRTEAAGRTFAIAGVLLGVILIVTSLGRPGLLVYGVVPLVLLSADGRDSIPLVFNDVAIYFSVGLLLWASRYLAGHSGVFRALLITTLLLNQLVFPYAVAIVLVRRLEGRSTRDVLLDLAVVGAGGVLILLAVGAGAGQLQAGLSELDRVFRFNFRPLAEAWPNLYIRYWREALNLGTAGAMLVPAAWLIVLLARQWRTLILLPAYFLFASLLPQYSTVHHFARLQFVVFSLVTLTVGLDTLIERLWRPPVAAAVPVIARLAAGVLIAVGLATAAPQYHTDPHIRATRASLMRVVQDPANAAALSRCNAFTFRLPEGHHYHYEYSPAGRIGQFFFADRVAARVHRGEPLRRCVVDLVDHTLREIN